MVQIAYRNRELTSYLKINHVFVSSKAVFTEEALSSQCQAAITLCNQSYVGTQNTIEIHNIEINPLANYLDVSGCSGANNKAQIKVKTHRPPCRFLYFRFSGTLFPVSMIDGDFRKKKC